MTKNIAIEKAKEHFAGIVSRIWHFWLLFVHFTRNIYTVYPEKAGGLFLWHYKRLCFFKAGR